MTPGTSFENLSSPLFVAQITEDADAPLYELVEVWYDPSTAEYVTKVGGRYAGPDNQAVALDGTGYAVGDFVLVRSGDATGGTQWEVVASLTPGEIPRDQVFAASSRIDLNGAFVTDILSINLDGPGEYLVYGVVSGGVRMTAAAPDYTAGIKAGIGGIGLATTATNVKVVTADSAHSAVAIRGSCGFAVLVEIGSSGVTSFPIQAQLVTTGLPAVAEAFIANDDNGRTHIGYVRLDRAPGGSGPTGPQGPAGPTGPAGADGETIVDSEQVIVGGQIFGG